MRAMHFGSPEDISITTAPARTKHFGFPSGVNATRLRQTGVFRFLSGRLHHFGITDLLPYTTEPNLTCQKNGLRFLGEYTLAHYGKQGSSASSLGICAALGVLMTYLYQLNQNAFFKRIV